LQRKAPAGDPLAAPSVEPVHCEGVSRLSSHGRKDTSVLLPDPSRPPHTRIGSCDFQPEEFNVNGVRSIGSSVAEPSPCLVFADMI
jgi:hypothetical protein